jgi:peptide/nickel transport system substrate-binding protein
MRKPLSALLATSALVFAACSSSTPASPGPSSEVSQPSAPGPSSTGAPDLFGTAYNPDAGTQGGQILVGDWQEANQFNPFYASQQSEANVASAVFASLTIATEDYKYAPDLAADIPTTANGGVKMPGDNGDAMTITWKLKPDLKWSDGQPLTCDDFEFARQWVMDPGNSGLAGGTTGYEDISKIDCPDPSTIVYHWKNVYEAYINSTVTPLPKHYLSTIPMADQVKGAGFRANEVKNLPVSGAFKFESVTAGQELRLVRNDNYKGFKSNAPAKLDTLIFHWYADADAMIAGFAAGEVDFATDLQDSDIPKLEQQGLHDAIQASPALLYEFLRPNWADGSKTNEKGVGGCSRNPAVADRGKGCPMADPAMRQAVSYAIDKNAINTRLLGGNAQVANTNISPQAWYYFDQPPVTFDPTKANSILDAAGWTKGADGIRAKNGLKAKIELCTTTRQVREDTLALIVNWLKDIGIEGVPNAVDPSNIFVEYNDATIDTPCGLAVGNFDLAEHAFSQSLDPIGNYTSYHSSQFEPKGSNDAQVSDPDVDKAMETVKTNVDFNVIKQAMATFQQVYVQKTVEIPLYYRKNVDLVGPKLGNYFQNPTLAGPTWNAVDWYVKG